MLCGSNPASRNSRSVTRKHLREVQSFVVGDSVNDDGSEFFTEKVAT